MHVLFSAPAYKPAWRYGGPVVAVSRLAESLAAKGVRVTVFTSDSNLDQDLDIPIGRPVNVDGVEVWYFRRKDSFQKKLTLLPYLSRSVGFLYTPSMSPELDRLVPSVDIVHTQAPFVYGTFAAARVAARFGKPLVYHQHGAYNPQSLRFRRVKKSLYIAAIEKPIMRRAAVLVALTEFEASSFRRFQLPTPIRVIPIAVDTAELQPVKRSPSSQHIVTLGTLHYPPNADGIRWFVDEVFPKITSRVPDASVTIIGKNPPADFLAFPDRYAGRIRVTGYVPELLPYLQEAAIMVVPVRAGGGMRVRILEAFAGGMPVVTTTVGLEGIDAVP